jgi:para-nitrobenzyl esterase
MKRLGYFIFFVICSLAVSAQCPVLTVTGGKIQGVASATKGVTVYKGIPYAAPPTGELRWKAPQPVIPWNGVKVADTFGAAAMQASHVTSQRTEVKEFGQVDYIKEFYADGDPKMSEDCLYLNVWQPSKAKKGAKLPVAFWIHGGAFMGGFGYEREFGGDAYARKGVILVTINYRLGVLGFLAHPELSAENDRHLSGNYGLLDQIKALQWVRENISQFGGDPDNITIFGQSAGAMSVRNLMCSPLAKGLFARAIIQSGGGVAQKKDGVVISKLPDYEALGKKIFGDKSIKEMRAMSYEELQKVFFKYCMDNRTFIMLSPVIDGYVLSGDLAQRVDDASIPSIPYMIGSTRDDMSFTRMGESITNFSLKLVENGYKPAYVYEFYHRLPGDGSGAFHSSELWYMFGTLKNCWRPMTAADYELSNRMVEYWTNFMKKGNPNGKGLPLWKPCTTGLNEVMRLDVK